jgi:hypothetical protein
MIVCFVLSSVSFYVKKNRKGVEGRHFVNKFTNGEMDF